MLSLLIFLLAMSEQLKLSLRVAPIQGFEPATVIIEAIIPPQEGNRAACIVVDSESYYSSSCWELSGAEAPAVSRRTFKDVPAGLYIAVLNVDEGGGKFGVAKREFIVQGRGL